MIVRSSTQPTVRHSHCFTGAPHAGKTTLLSALRDRGFHVLPEAALGVIESLVHEHGADDARRWRAEHAAEFQSRVTLRQIALEEEAEVIGKDRPNRATLAVGE